MRTLMLVVGVFLSISSLISGDDATQICASIWIVGGFLMKEESDANV